MGRVLSCSMHSPDEITFDNLWEALGKDHFLSEQQLVHDLPDLTLSRGNDNKHKPCDKNRYIASLGRAKLMKKVDQGESEKCSRLPLSAGTALTRARLVWALLYQFSPPIADRVFTELQYIYCETTPENRRVGFVVTLPFDPEGAEEVLKAKASCVRGKYTSAERITELEDGKIEWM